MMMWYVHTERDRGRHIVIIVIVMIADILSFMSIIMFIFFTIISITCCAHYVMIFIMYHNRKEVSYMLTMSM